MRNKCPVCHSTNIHRLRTARRIGSTVGAVGGAATGAGGALSGAQTGAAQLFFCKSFRTSPSGS